ncbi:MAG: CoA pyrophosphatase [Blastocatellia bacterium]|nr:MAG: CoA pyrophosphatase [Blastocatellia bacterium]
MTFDSAYRRLQVALREPLPGAEAQALMAPRPRRDWPEGFNQAHVRHAAGLLLLFPIEGDAHIVLTLRADTLGRHGGQISLPGGVAEAGETFEDAALREAHEEVALPAAIVHVLGRLTPIDIPVSGFRLHPVVGAAATRPPLRPADGEVAGILEVAIADLFDSSHRGTVTRLREGREVIAPTFRVGNAEVWGATAMVLAEFLTLLGWNPGMPPDSKR